MRADLSGWAALPLAALVCGSIVLLGVLAWNRSLHDEVQRRTSELRSAVERQAMQADILGQVTDAIVTTDHEARVTSWNGGAATLFGIPERQSRGQAIGTLITDRMATPRGGDLHEAIASGSDWHGDAEIVRPSGDTRFIEATVRPLMDGSGSRRGVIIMARDVDARRRAEIDAEVRARQQAVVASLGQRALAGIEFGLLLKQAVSLTSRALDVPAAGVFQLADDSSHLTRRAGVGWEVSGDGDVTMTFDPRTYPSCAIGTEGGAFTFDPRTASCPPVDALHLREGIVAGAAVLIPGRTGPYGLLVVADRRGRRFSRDDVHFLQAIGNVIGAAFERSIIDTNQMLAYSGKGRFVLRSTGLSEIVGEMTHLLRTAVAKNAEIALNLDPDLPPFDGDPAQIRQVIMNLITNASDAIGTSPGQITLVTGRMQVTREYVADAWVGSDVAEGEFVFAQVTDTGCGMDAATLSRIFDPFFTTKFTGRGLGLAAVLGIVRGHDGAIKITSTPGRGSTFRVLLPVSGAVRPVVEAPPVRPVPVAAAAVANARILVVDDEAGVRAIARESLKRAGFVVTTANDGSEALDALGVAAFDAVLLDLTMPRMNGVEALRLIKERQPELPVVLTSGYSAQEAADRVSSDSLAGFIQKPFMPAALVQAMLEAVGQRR
jgi:PAS domain S-box-containing protein